MSLALAVLLCLSALGAYTYLQGDRRSRPGLQVEPSQLYLGEILETEGLQHSFTIKNTTEEEVAIRGYNAYCNCTSIQPELLVIPPGGTADVRLTVHLLLGPARDKTEERVVPVAWRLVPKAHPESAADPDGWTFRAFVHRVLDFDPAQLNFGSLQEGEAVPPRTLLVKAVRPVAALEAKSLSDAVPVEVVKSDQPPNAFAVKVAPSSTLPPGPFRHELVLVPKNPSPERLPTYRLTVQGLVIPEYQAVPPALHLGARSVGDTMAETLVLVSAHKRPFEVIDVEASSSDTVVEPDPKVHPHGAQFRVSQRIGETGPRTSNIKFSVRKADGGMATIPLPISYVGLPRDDVK